MKILYHHRTYARDGARVHIEELVGSLRRLGHEVVVVGPSGAEAETGEGDRSAPGAFSRLFDALRGRMPRAVTELMELAYSLHAYRRLAAAADRHRPDVLYERYNLFLPAGLWLSRRRRLPMLLEVNSPLVYERAREPGLALRRLARWSERRVWRGADRVLPVSEALADHVRAAGVPDSRITVIRNGINPQRFAAVPSRADAKARLGLDGRLVLGFTGYVREWHRLDVMVDLLADPAMPPDVHLLVVGDGPARRTVEARAAEKGVAARITFTGVVPHAEVPRHVAAFDIALQPAVTPYASPLKLAEYLVLGCAVVAPGQENIREVLDDGANALLFPPGDVAGLRDAVLRLCTDDALRRRLGEAGRHTITARRLTWGDNARRVAALFEDLLRARDARTGPAAAVLAPAEATSDPPRRA